LIEHEICVRNATEEDLAFVSQDGSLLDAIVRRKVTSGDAIFALQGGGPVGYLLLEWLWSKLPHIELIWVQGPQRRPGVGRALLACTEVELVSLGHAELVSSSQADEPESQAGTAGWGSRSAVCSPD